MGMDCGLWYTCVRVYLDTIGILVRNKKDIWVTSFPHYNRLFLAILKINVTPSTNAEIVSQHLFLADWTPFQKLVCG